MSRRAHFANRALVGVLVLACLGVSRAQSGTAIEFAPGERYEVPTAPDKALATALVLANETLSDGESVYLVLVETTIANSEHRGGAYFVMSAGALSESVGNRISAGEDLSAWQSPTDTLRSRVNRGDATVLRKTLQEAEWPNRYVENGRVRDDT